MRKDKIRFHRMIFDWNNEMVYIKYIVGTQEHGGYEDEIFITFEKFPELVDTKKLRKLLTTKRSKELT